MFGILKSKRPARSAPRIRSFLRLEELSLRDTPSDLGDPPVSPPPPPPPGQELPPPLQGGPVINSFTAAEMAHGWYQISGHVNCANPQGLIVRFDGVPALEGKTAVVDANGNFTLVIEVATDGTDTGTISAQTTQNGVDSNLALTYMNPTP